MPVDWINPVVALAFVLVWWLVGTIWLAPVAARSARH